ncbi:MAG: hypothetical protein ACT6Q7_02735 [Blastomonas fulva]|uniref:hypothetical protein n=1 Tax=Blastomonas fulva TaxID=1550728 RepID=UPI0040349754
MSAPLNILAEIANICEQIGQTSPEFKIMALKLRRITLEAMIADITAEIIAIQDALFNEPQDEEQRCA